MINTERTKIMCNALLASALIAIMTTASSLPVGLASAESSCLAGFKLVTTTEAGTVDSQVPQIDSNGDGLLCELNVTTSGGAINILFTDNAVSHPGSCPDSFRPILWPPGTDPDRNGNGVVCEKIVSQNRMMFIIIDDNKPAPGSADLGIFKRAPATVDTGSQFDYTLGITNSGPDSASNVIVTDTLPSGVTFVSAGGSGWTCSQSSGVVKCITASLAAGYASMSGITITVVANQNSGCNTIITNTAEVSSATSDPNTLNNRSTADTVVECPPQPF